MYKLLSLLYIITLCFPTQTNFVENNKLLFAQNTTQVIEIAITSLNSPPKGAENPFPNGILPEVVSFEDNTATINLTNEFIEHHSGGSYGEILTVSSIVNTLLSIKGVDKVKIIFNYSDETPSKWHLDYKKKFKTKMKFPIDN